MAFKRSQLPARQPSQSIIARSTTRHGRRLSDKIRDAFHTACDEHTVEIAERLLQQLGLLIHRPPILPTGVDRRRPESTVAVCERLANLLLWKTQSDWALQPGLAT
jgi:hypothetical protein